MAQTDFRTILRPGKRGSKQGWSTVSGEIPPETGEAWRELIARRGCFQTDLVREAVELLLRAEGRKGQGRRANDAA